MKILLIEDDTQLCMTIKEQLTKEGYIVDTCNAGDEAFLYAVDPDNDYDLAIIDRMLPIIDGLSIIKAMRQKNILLTPKEFHLIQIFLSSPGTIFSREQLLQKVWNTNDEVEPGNVDNYIYFLRKRLKCLNSNCCINSVYGSGYSLEVKHD